MPSQPVTIYDEDGNPTVMHSVDAKEAVMLGGYTYAAPSSEPDPEKMAAARAKFATGQAEVHPELLSEEDRQAKRDEANAKAEILAAIPEGAQVVVMAPPAPAAAQARAAQVKRPAGTAPVPPPPAQTTTSSEHRER